MVNLPKLTLLRTGTAEADSADADALKPLFHVHIPKCAGTTLDEILFGLAKVKSRPYFRIPGTIYHQKFAGMGKTEALDKIKNLNYPSNWLCASGHIPYGKFPLHDSALNEVAIIREPSVRLMSMFRMGVRRGAWSVETPIKQIFDSGLLVENSMVRQLAGECAGTTKLTEDHVEVAFRNYEAIKYKGCVEDFENVVCSILADYGIPYVAFHRFQTDERLSDFEPSKLANELEPYMKLDQIFYRRSLDSMRQMGKGSMEVRIGDVPPNAPVLFVTPFLFTKGQQIRSVFVDIETLGNLVKI